MQVRVFNKNGTAIAAQWSSDSAAWVEIGEVTGQGNSGDGGEVHGVVYDHIMPVEIETAQGLVTLQLGYNELENPFISAQRFIDQNQLDQNYLSQIADFITARAGKSSAPTFDMSSSSSSTTHPMDVVTGGEDSGSKRPRPSYTQLPLQVYFSYEDIPSGLQSKFMTKIRDFNTAFAASDVDARGVLSDSDLDVLEDTLGVLADTSHYHSSRVPKTIYSVLNTMLSHWVDGKTLFPSFDLLRMIAAHPSGALQLASSPYLSAMLSKTASVLTLDFAGASQCLTDASIPSCSPQALTALRFLVTSCRHAALRHKVLGLMFSSSNEGPFSIFTAMIGSLTSLSSWSKVKGVHRHALSSWCANIVLACCTGEDTLATADTRAKVLGCYYPVVVYLLEKEADSIDVIVRSLLAVGTVAVNHSLSEKLKGDLLLGAAVENVLTTVQEKWSGKTSEYVDLCLSEVSEAVYSQSS
jgi:hypothetical protein